MMYVKTNAPKTGNVAPKAVTQMGVPMQDIKKNEPTRDQTSYVKAPVKETKPPKDGFAAKVKKLSPGKMIFFSLVFGALGLMYLTHVYSTQQHLKDVSRLNREYERAKRIYADRKFTYDRMIGPAEVYDRAKGIGLKDGGPADGLIYVEKE